MLAARDFRTGHYQRKVTIGRKVAREGSARNLAVLVLFRFLSCSVALPPVSNNSRSGERGRASRVHVYGTAIAQGLRFVDAHSSRNIHEN